MYRRRHAPPVSRSARSTCSTIDPMTVEASRSGAALEPLLTAGARSAINSPAARWLLAPAALAWLCLLWLSGGEHTLALCIAPRGNLFDVLLANLAAGFDAIAPG